jgi:hypothetical protein
MQTLRKYTPRPAQSSGYLVVSNKVTSPCTGIECSANMAPVHGSELIDSTLISARQSLAGRRGRDPFRSKPSGPGEVCQFDVSLARLLRLGLISTDHTLDG